MHIHTFFSFFFFFFTVLSHWDFTHGKVELLSPGKAAVKESCFPAYSACWVFSCFHNPPNSDMDYRIFNVLTYVNACDNAWGCLDIKRVCTEIWLWEKNPLPRRGIKPTSAVCQSNALLTELHPHNCDLHSKQREKASGRALWVINPLQRKCHQCYSA